MELPNGITYEKLRALFPFRCTADVDYLVDKTISVLDGQPFKRKGTLAQYIVQKLPMIGAVAIDVAPNSGVVNCIVRMNERFANGFDWNNMTGTELEQAGFQKLKVQNFITVYAINRNVRAHFIHTVREALVLQGCSNEGIQKISVTDLEVRSSLTCFGNNRLAVLPVVPFGEITEELSLP